jgi:hypothetical protein
MMEKAYAAAATKRASSVAALATFEKAESGAKAAPAKQVAETKADEALNGDDLLKLLRWKMPSGASKVTLKADRLAKWKELKSLPDPPAPTAPELSEVPFAEELARIKERMERPALRVPPPPPPPPPPRRGRLALTSARNTRQWTSWTRR